MAHQTYDEELHLGNVAWQMRTLLFDSLFSKNDWLADSGTLSHIATRCSMFAMFNLELSKVGGFGEDMELEATVMICAQPQVIVLDFSNEYW